MSRSEVSSSTSVPTSSIGEDKSITTKRGNMMNNKNTASYMSDANVKEFNKAIREHTLKTFHPNMAFQSVEKLEEELCGYFDLCDNTNTVPTIVGIALYLGVNRDTIYAHANNPKSPVSDIFKNVINYCHMIIENGAIAGKVNPVTYIFLGKNYFSLSDSRDINIIPTTNQDVNTPATMEALQKQIEQENIANAEYTERLATND